MLAYQIEIDEKKVLLAGVKDWGFLGIHINATRGDPKAPAESARTDRLDLSVGGITEQIQMESSFTFFGLGKNCRLGLGLQLLSLKQKTPIPPLNDTVQTIRFRKNYSQKKKSGKCGGKRILN